MARPSPQDLPTRIRRALLRWLARGKGEMKAVQALRHVREVARFAVMFATTILGPAMVLSGLALSSIRTSELQLDADLRARADTMADSLHEELAALFLRFEEATIARLSRGESALDNLSELSPYLRGAYRFDASGRLAAPFEFEDSRPLPPPHAAWRELMAEGRGLEQESPRQASARYAAAAKTIREPAYAAEALLSQARALYAAGDVRAAEQILEDLRSQDWSRVRQTRGFRVGDVASFLRAEHAFRKEPAVGARALQDLVEQLLTTHWAIGHRDSAFVRRALELLDQHVDPDWLARMRARLNERSDQLRWAMQVRDELELLNVRTPDTGFRYYGARVDSDALWATARTSSGLYAFSFSVEALTADLVASAIRLTNVDPDLKVRLALSNEPLPSVALNARPLDPWLGYARVIVEPQDAPALALRKDQQRRQRLAIIGVSLFLVVVGVAFSARIIGQELESARMKADFAANVSHELRSPITQIRLKGEALQLGLVEPGEDTRAHYDAIVREAERLSRLVDNVLDFAAIERGAKRYQLRPDDLNTVVWQTVESNRESVESKGLTLELDLPEDLPPIWLDREAIGQVLVNLLSNAVKYGAEGGWIGVRIRPGLDGVDIDVADRGMGIPPKDLDHVFDHFYRSTDPEVRRRKGTGIGLTIVRYIVEAHGGTIGVESTPGMGTTFTITLPLEPPEGAGERV